MNRLRIYGADAGDFTGGRLIWNALNGLRPAKSLPFDEVDLADVQLLRPYSLATIAVLGALAGRQARLILPSTQDARDYVVRSGLTSFFIGGEDVALGKSRRIVPVRQIDRIDPAFADEVTLAWEQEFGGMPAGLRPRFADHLDEIIRNALAHSESTVGCVVAATVYPLKRHVELCVLDVGQSVRVHLTRNPKHAAYATDADAIVGATGEGVSGTLPGTLNLLGEPNSGVGLFDLRQYCESGGGELTIASGEAMVTFGIHNSPEIRHFAGGLPGCLINAKFFMP